MADDLLDTQTDTSWDAFPAAQPAEQPSAPASSDWGSFPAATVGKGLAPDFDNKVAAWKATVQERLGLEPVITEGYRDPARSDALRAQGIVALPGGQSYHNYGQAFDYGFKKPDGKTDLYNEKAYAQAGKIAQEFGISTISNESGHLQNSGFSIKGAKPYTPGTSAPDTVDAQVEAARATLPHIGDVKRTEYGPDVDAARIGRDNPDSLVGDRGNTLQAGDVALTRAQRQAQFGVTGKSTGKTFVDQGNTVTDADTAPESDKRIDYWRGPGGKTQDWRAFPLVDQTSAPSAVPVAQPVGDQQEAYGATAALQPKGAEVRPAKSVESGYAA